MNTPSPSAGSGRPPLPTSTASPRATPSPGADVAVPPKRWAAIVSDLESRGVPTAAVALVSSRSVTWNDGSLGCPKPGQSYTQALVDGMQVVVAVGEERYDYRFGNSDSPRLCQQR